MDPAWDRPGLRKLRALALFAAVLKFSDLRLWPHAYAGEVNHSPLVSDLATLAFLGSALALAWAMRSWLSAVVAADRPLWLFLAFAGLHSVLLSQDPQASLREFVLLSFAGATAAICVLADGVERTARRLATAFLAIGLLHLAALAIPEVSVMRAPHAGSFRGLADHKNTLSFHALIGATVATCLRGWSWRRLALLAVSAALLLMSRSAQGLILFLLVLALGGSVLAARRGRIVVLVLLVTVLAEIALLATQTSLVETFFGVFGKDADLTGRDVIWRFFAEDFQASNWTGYGLGAFFREIDNIHRLQASGITWLIGTAHSAYIEAFVALGLVGGVWFLWLTLPVFAGAFADSFRRPGQSLLAPSLLLICVVGGITASEKMFLPTLGWFAFVIGRTLARQAPAAGPALGDEPGPAGPGGQPALKA